MKEKPEVATVTSKENKVNKKEDKKKVKSYYNKTTHDKPSYKPKNDVVVQILHDQTWSPTKVVCTEGPRSFTVQKESGDMLHRNTFHLRHSLNKCNVSPDFSDTGTEAPKERENINIPENKMGGRSPTALSASVENQIAESLKARARMGYPCNKEELRDLVETYVVQNNLETLFKDDRPGLGWYYNFMSRHKGLSFKKPEHLQIARKKQRKPDIIYNFYEQLENIGEKKIDNPAFVFNADESAFEFQVALKESQQVSLPVYQLMEFCLSLSSKEVQCRLGGPLQRLIPEWIVEVAADSIPEVEYKLPE
ncbi:hypothetical protein ILUMI_16311 [Ignelater luminosus]|uniref:HTH CENPB-type domain-containing protein n=1 Tax=Ignelater luminosus TaxID=2038154 RepID=A0A8K0CRA6_IGNLU|nr:hypothetical protein ILUMI_16311 [Ignelater luminosus]